MAPLDRTRTSASEAPVSAQGELWLLGPNLHRRLALSEGTMTLGRSPDNTVCLDHVSISRQHLTIFVGRDITVEDLGSHNGTQLNGRRLEPTKRYTFGANDLLELGPFRVLVQQNELAPSATSSVGEVVLKSPLMLKQWGLARQVARGDISILVRGETGVGKDVLAREIHRASKRAGGPFVRLNCAALSEPLLESELFGHVRGAFTGAAGARQGLIEAADSGTLFLDEVGELSLVLQAKLLHVLETRELTPVGSNAPRKVDVRFVSATHRDLERSANFRSDLYFRLAGAVIEVPALRDRREDVLPLAEHFLQAWAIKQGQSTPQLSAAARKELEQHPWPGNVRELRNVLEHASLTQGAMIEHLSFGSTRAAAPGAEPQTDSFQFTPAERAERERIIEALNACAGNQTRAAKALGWARSTLASKLLVYRIPRPRS